MSPKQLADVLLLIAASMPLTENDRYEVIGRVAAGLMLEMPTTSTSTISTSKEASVAAPNSSTQELEPGPVMIPKGNQCACDACTKVSYILGAPVYENTKKKDFVAAFIPQNGAPTLVMPLDTWADEYGNLAIDCPLCHGNKTLWIKGKGPLPYRDVGGTGGGTI